MRIWVHRVTDGVRKAFLQADRRAALPPLRIQSRDEGAYNAALAEAIATVTEGERRFDPVGPPSI